MLNGPAARLDATVLSLGAPITAISEPMRASFGTLSPTFQPKDLSTGRLQAILDSLEDAVLLVDALEQPLYVNEAVFELLGLNPACETLEVWAATVGIATTQPGTLGAMQQPYPWEDFPLAQVLRGETGNVIELHLRHPRVPTVQWLRVRATPLKGQDGHIAGAVVVLRDITARKRYEADLQNSRNSFKAQADQLTAALADLQAAQSRLVQSEKMSSLGQLVAGVAHEINNPVNFIHGNLVHVDAYVQDLLGLMDAYQQHLTATPPALEAYLDAVDLPFMREDLPKLVASMRIGTERIREIVVSLRNFSRLDEAAMKTVDLHEGLDSTLTILANRLRGSDREASVQVDKTYGALPRVECYPGQLNQVFMNLFANALDALGEQRRSLISHPSADSLMAPPTITIYTEMVSQDWVRIEIANNGPAIPESVQRRIFDPFFTTKPVGQGKGMGLAISYQTVVEQHGGSLKCISYPGEGVAFRIDIPVKQVAFASAAA
ncbi:MAG: ATP-binding protein [Cyanobacteria bacterium]|nr:ATP-binding protein [Cyanobacteriota bacterium]